MQKKIIIETNWWISFILSKYSGKLPDFFFNKTFDFYFSKELLTEISDTLKYPRIEKRINHINLQKYFDFISEFAIMIETEENIIICRDPKDNFLLALAKAAGANFLITKDEDLLILEQFENTLIITLDQFIKMINE